MLKEPNPKIALVNDTSLYSAHFGCQIVGQVLREQFKRVGLDLVLSLPKRFNEEEKSQLSKVDLVVVNGEGSIHHGRNMHLIDLAERYRAVLLNCVYQGNPPNENLGRFHLVTARESLSAKEIQCSGVMCKVVPDLIFGSSLVWSFRRPAPTLDLGVTDSVLKECRIGPIKIRMKSDIKAKKIHPGAVLEKLSNYRRICTGRFHAAVLATILDIPFNAWESNTWKIRGMLEDMGLTDLWHPTRHEALKNVPYESRPEMLAFAQESHDKIESTFDNIARIAREKS